MPVEWIEHKGVKILYANYRGIKDEEGMLRNLEAEDEVYSKAASKIISLNDYRDSVLSKEFMSKVTEMGKKYKAVQGKAAVLGITGMKKIMLNGYSAITGDPIRSFDDEESAKAYLLK